MDMKMIKDITLIQWVVLIPLSILIYIAFQLKLYQWRNKKLLSIAAKLPMPLQSSALLGNWFNPKNKIMKLEYSVEDFTNILRMAMKAASSKPYSLFCIWVGPMPEIFVQKPQDAQTILTSSKALEKGSEYKFARFVFKDGLITAPGPKWKISRRNMNPIFHRQNLNYLTAVFNRSSRQLVKDLACHADGETFDVFQSLHKASVTSVCSILFGLESQSKMENKDFALGDSITLRIAHLIMKRASKPWLWPDIAFNHIYKNELGELEKTWSQFISRPMKERIENGELLTVPEAYSNVMQDHPMFSEADMEAEMKTVLVAGSDTTAIGVSSCLLLLGNHPEIQEKLYNEISSFLCSEDQDVTIEDLNFLPFLDQVIKESLRLSPVVLCFKRTLNDDIKLSEHTIPKGGNVVISVYGLHFDPEVYPDPYVFNPDRFTPENTAKRHPYSFLPFSGGPRNCIGKQYAMISMKIMLLYILKRYKIHSRDNIFNLRYVFVISLISVDGYKISLERRNK